MINLYKNIYCGNQLDAEYFINSNDWIILHCCKEPYHKQLVGYRGNLSQNHPNYAYIIKDNHMALNLVDIDAFNPNYVEFNKKMFQAAFDFLGVQDKSKKILIHCNKGESRGPSITMLYLAHIGYFKNLSYNEASEAFKKLYPMYNPRYNILKNVELLWDHFRK